jgi:hypothetical protein
LPVASNYCTHAICIYGLEVYHHCNLTDWRNVEITLPYPGRVCSPQERMTALYCSKTVDSIIGLSMGAHFPVGDLRKKKKLHVTSHSMTA